MPREPYHTREDPPNPFAEISRQTGISPGKLCDACKLSPKAMKVLLAEPPRDTMRGVCMMLKVLNAKIRLLASPEPFRIWVASIEADQLWYNPYWRKSAGLDSAPPRKRMALKHAIDARRADGESDDEIATYLNRNFIPLVAPQLPSRYKWDAKLVRDYHVKLGHAEYKLLHRRVEWRRAWRYHVSAWVMGIIVFDREFSLRYEFRVAIDDYCIMIYARKPTPSFVCDLIERQAASRLKTFFKEFGFGDPDVPPECRFHPDHPDNPVKKVQREIALRQDGANAGRA